MNYRKIIGLFATVSIASSPLALVISCGSDSAPLDMGDSIKAIDNSQDNPFKLYNMPYSDGTTLFTQSELQKLRKLFKDKLYYGPEAWDLKSIVLDPGNITSGSQLGVYYPSTKQIFINVSDLKTLSYDQATDVITKVVAHEYGHHFFATYANGYRYKGVIDPNIKSEENYVYDNTGNPRYLSAWNKDFFDEFVSDYKMNDNTLKTKQPYQENCIDSTFSLAQLFNNANKKDASLDWKDQTKVSFNATGNYWELPDYNSSWTPASYVVSVDKSDADSLKYIYSIDEQATRKMQMLFYPEEIQAGKFSFDSSLLKISNGESAYFDPYSVDWLRTANLFSDGSSVHKMSIYQDDIFKNHKSKDAYDALLKLMGYNKQISHMYSYNGALVSSPNMVTGLSSSNNNKVMITGYIDSKNGFTKIVDDNDNLITKIHPSTSMSDRFHFFAKSSWNSKTADVKPDGFANTEKVPYSSDYFNVGSYSGKQLFFENNDGSKEAISDINLSDDNHTNVNSYDTQRPYDGNYYKLSKIDGKIIVKGYE